MALNDPWNPPINAVPTGSMVGGPYYAPNTTMVATPRAPNWFEGIESDAWRMRAIGMRLQYPEANALPFTHITTALGTEKVFVFILQNDKPVVLEDDRGLFPSDTLVTQLKLIAG